MPPCFFVKNAQKYEVKLVKYGYISKKRCQDTHIQQKKSILIVNKCAKFHNDFFVLSYYYIRG